MGGSMKRRDLQQHSSGVPLAAPPRAPQIGPRQPPAPLQKHKVYSGKDEYTPTGFETLAGKAACRKWRLSLR